jgi:hypothetical protein
VPPGIGYPGQPQQQGGFDPQQLFQQFLAEMMGIAPPSPPGSGGGVYAPGSLAGGQFVQPQAPQPQPQQPQQQAPQQQQPQQQAPQQAPQPAAQPVQPAPQPVPAPILQPVQPIQFPGVLPGAFGGGGQTIGATSTPAGVLSNALFGFG